MMCLETLKKRVMLFMFNLLIVSVCNAGHFGSGFSCTICPGNTIKPASGDAANCDAAEPCDGTTTVPNAGHTACGE